MDGVQAYGERQESVMLSEDGKRGYYEGKEENTIMMKTIAFGKYPFGKDAKPAEIQWLALESRQDGTTLLISRDCLEAGPYTETFTEEEELTWEDCDLNRWLNTDFMDAAFDQSEKESLCDIDSVIQDGLEQRTKVTLLRAEEAERFFPNPKDRRAKPTPWADRAGHDEYDGICVEDGCAGWYLRDASEIIDGNYTMVYPSGGLDLEGADCIYGRVQCIRPVILVRKSFSEC